MQSMTGFGRADLKTRIGKLTIEIASVNNRFLEFSIRLPRQYVALEPVVREHLATRLSRGKVSVNVAVEEPVDAPGRYVVNKTALKEYSRQLRKIQKELKLSGDVSISDLVMLPEVIQAEKGEINLDEAWRAVRRGLKASLEKFVAMRSREGKAMATDMLKRLDALGTLIGSIEKQTTGSVKVYGEKLKQRIEELLDGPVRDSVRLEEEIAFFADRTDIAEECVRFRSHLDEFRSALKAKDAIGRRLNFILQEMNREANTIGSKSADFSISTFVISLKEEIEKLREMVQNAE